MYNHACTFDFSLSLDALVTIVCQGRGQVQLTKYSSTSSTPNIYQVQVLVKYSFFKKVLQSTSSTFISSTSTSTSTSTCTSTSTHIKIGSRVGMDIQSRVNFGWTK